MKHEINNVQWYLGKDLKESIDDRLQKLGHGADTLHYIIAAVLQANEDHVSMMELHQMIEAANDYRPAPVSVDDLKKKLGFG